MTLQVGVKVFLKNNQGKYLLLKRNTQKYPTTKGVWDIVGGRINPGTPLIDNLKREVEEETQLKITSDPILIHAQDIIPNKELHVVRLTYLGETNGEPVLDLEENTEYKWLTLDEIKEHKDVDKYVEEVLREKLNQL